MSRWFGSQLVEWRVRVHPPECIPPRHCFPVFLPRDHHHRLLPSSPSLWHRYREDFRENRDYRSRFTRLRRASSVSFFEWRVIQFPCEGQISGAADIILHAGRSDIKSHLRESPLPVIFLTFHRVYNGFLSRRIVQVTRALHRRWWKQIGNIT